MFSADQEVNTWKNGKRWKMSWTTSTGNPWRQKIWKLLRQQRNWRIWKTQVPELSCSQLSRICSLSPWELWTFVKLLQILKITSSVPQDFSNFEEIIKKQLHDVIPDLLKAAMATLPTTGQGNPKETKEEKSIKVVFFDDKQRYAVIQVSAESRESIRRNGDCVNCHCQEFGHMANSRYCKDKDKDPTCFYCGGSHTSRDCMNKEDNKIKKMKCSNCCKSRNHSEKNSAAIHKASDNLCPSFVRERAAIMPRTAGCEQAKNSYIQRMKEAKARLGRV